MLTQLLMHISEYSSNGYFIQMLSILSTFSILFAICVIISKNPIYSVLFLIALFGSISIYLIMAGLGFIGLSYLIVYIGAVSILFLFILMLIDIRISELESNTINSMPLAIIILILFNSSSFIKIFTYRIELLRNNFFTNPFQAISDLYTYFFKNLNFNEIFYVTDVMWDGTLADMNDITSIGNIMYTNYGIWFIMASFILLLAMVGSIIITLKLKGDSDYNTIIQNESEDF